MDKNNPISFALNTIHESDTIIKIKRDQIIVIGRLMQEVKEANKKCVAGLLPIPYIGNLFRVNTLETKKLERMVLLKTTLINNQDD